MQRYPLSIIAVITAAGLAGCAGQSQYDVQFFKAFFGAQSPTSFRILTVRQTDAIPSSQPARKIQKAESHPPVVGAGGGHETASGQGFADGEQ
jgi:hypothetical protein